IFDIGFISRLVGEDRIATFVVVGIEASGVDGFSRRLLLAFQQLFIVGLLMAVMVDDDLRSAALHHFGGFGLVDTPLAELKDSLLRAEIRNSSQHLDSLIFHVVHILYKEGVE